MVFFKQRWKNCGRWGRTGSRFGAPSSATSRGTRWPTWRSSGFPCSPVPGLCICFDKEIPAVHTLAIFHAAKKHLEEKMTRFAREKWRVLRVKNDIFHTCIRYFVAWLPFGSRRRHGRPPGTATTIPPSCSVYWLWSPRSKSSTWRGSKVKKEVEVRRSVDVQTRHKNPVPGLKNKSPRTLDWFPAADPCGSASIGCAGCRMCRFLPEPLQIFPVIRPPPLKKEEKWNCMSMYIKYRVFHNSNVPYLPK